MKAISAVVATILMLVITIALGGTAYLYISGILSGTTSTAFSIIDTYNDTVVIRNDGTDAIKSITATVDGIPVGIAMIPNINGLTGYWSLNEGSGDTAADSSGNGNMGNLVNGPSWVDGEYDKALQFHGTGDYVDAGNGASLNATNAITIEVWVKS